MVRIDNIRLNLNESEDLLYVYAERELKSRPVFFRILKKSLDARRKNDIHWVYSIECASKDVPLKQTSYRQIKCNEDIYIVGAGPAGLFAAVRLAQYGLRPIILERGSSVENRTEEVESFFNGGYLDENSNVQFGEGGAGTFSDGKLNTQTHSGYTQEVLELFVRFGAPNEVAYLNKPHIGSDKLVGVLKNIRQYIESCGGKFLFNTRFDSFIQSNGVLKAIRYTDLKSNTPFEKSASKLILAIGHSARDTFYSICNSGLKAERRNFAVGLRIEHSQERISRAQYGTAWKDLPPSSYKMVSKSTKRPVFTFCNCPGGYVVAAASELGGICTNGMSLYERAGANCNSALLVNILDEDLKSDDLFAGVNYQRQIEQAAFKLAGGGFKAPACYVGDLLGKKDSSVKVSPTYSRGVTFVHPSSYLPEFVVTDIKAAIIEFGKKLHGFDSAGALLTGPETRFTSPLRFLRNELGESITIKDVYPAGEGSGYSGGITSSAADGLRCADRIAAQLS